MKKLTIKQKMTLESIEWFISENKYSPTFREISKMLNKDVSTVFDSVMQLEKKGYVKTCYGKSRSIVVLKPISN